MLPPAGLLRRLAAAGYDLLLLAGVLMLTSFLVIIARGGAVPAGNPAYQLFIAAQAVVFFVAFWSRGGQTLGMRAWNIRVETHDGKCPSPAVATLRFAGALISAAALGLGFLWIMIDADGRAWHDRLSGTRVVHRRTQSARAGAR